jgi:predicted urease superfamily metal-dependent hydrolase
MHSTSQVFVTLSPDLLRHLCELARTQDVPIQWIVAGLICDTIDTGPESAKNAALRSVKRVAHRRTTGNLRASARPSARFVIDANSGCK